MLNLRTKTVNVSRKDLLAHLYANLEEHKSEYKQALLDYQDKVIADLSAALARSQAGDFTKVTVSVDHPKSHEQDFMDVISMLEMSVDETINLDSEAFKAYFRNEWPWKRQFDMLMASYKS